MPCNSADSCARGQHGAALVVVLLALGCCALLGLASLELSRLSRLAGRQALEHDLALQGAEAALQDAEIDLHGPGASARRDAFLDPRAHALAFADRCTAGGLYQGLCSSVADAQGRPAWQGVDFGDPSAQARSTALGRFTSRPFASGPAGLQPCQLPRYVIERLPDPDSPDPSAPLSLFRITAAGFGSQPHIQVLLQTVYRP